MFWKVLTGFAVFALIILISVVTASMAVSTSALKWAALVLFSLFLGITVGALPLSHEMDKNSA
jgi:hypothetical protein